MTTKQGRSPPGRASRPTDQAAARLGDTATIPNAVRSKDNCQFYPSCYIAGDCGFDDWKTSNCGLPKDEQARLREEWWANLTLRNARWRLGEDLKRQAQAGQLDHMLAAGIEARSDATPKSDAAGTAKARSEGAAQ